MRFIKSLTFCLTSARSHRVSSTNLVRYLMDAVEVLRALLLAGGSLLRLVVTGPLVVVVLAVVEFVFEVRMMVLLLLGMEGVSLDSMVLL